MIIHEIVHKIDDSGEKIVVVPLSNSYLKAKLYEKDFAELVEFGAGLPWKFTQGQVVVRNNNKNVNVGRLIVDADKGAKISFVDGNPVNLCKSNLIRIAGSAKYRARDQLVRRFKHAPAEYRDIA